MIESFLVKLSLWEISLKKKKKGGAQPALLSSLKLSVPHNRRTPLGTLSRKMSVLSMLSVTMFSALNEKECSS